MCIVPYMSPKRRVDVMVEPHQVEALKKLQHLTGAPVSEHIRRAIDDYLQKMSGPSRKINR